MRVISKPILKEFWAEYPAAEQPLKAWHKTTSDADWNSPAELKQSYRSADILKSGRVIFDIGGNKYRIVARVNFVGKVVLIKFVGTHEEYNKIDAQTVEPNLRKSKK